MKEEMRLLSLALLFALTATFTNAQNLILDDFSVGPYKKTLPTKNAAVDINVQTGNALHLVGAERETDFLVCHQIPCTAAENKFGQTSVFQIRPSKTKDTSSALVFNAGYRMDPRLDIFYGVNGPNASLLDLDLTPYDRLRVSFDGLNSVVNFNIELYSATGNGILGCNLGPGSRGTEPFTVDFPLKDFVGGSGSIDLLHITYMDVIFQSGGVGSMGTLSFAVTGFEAVPVNAPPADFPCNGQ